MIELSARVTSIFSRGVVRVTELRVVVLTRKLRLRPAFLDRQEVRMLRDVALQGVDDVDDRVRADLKSQIPVFQNHHYPVGLRLHTLQRVQRNPLSRQPED